MLFRVFTAVVSALIATVASAGIGEWRVGPSGDSACDFNDIQDAIDATAANDGGLSTINVRVAGSAADHRGNTYSINAADFDNVDTFRIIGGYDSCAASSPSAGAQTVLDADGTGRVFHLVYNASDTDPVRTIELENLEITGGLAPFAGGGVRVEGHSGRHRIQIRNVLVTGNNTQSVGSGGGISIETDQASDSPTAWVTIGQGSIIHNNRADGGGGGLACFNTSGGNNPPVLLFNTAVISNQAVFNGGGLALSGCKGFSVRTAGFDNGIRLNVAGSENESGDGGGIHVANGGELTLEASGNERSAVVFGNSADNGGGLALIDDGSTAELVNTRITTNSANADGGGLLVREADLTMGRVGGVTGFPGDCLPQFDSASRCSVVFGNTAGGDGGGIAVFGPEFGRINRATFDQTLIHGNFSDGGLGSAAYQSVAEVVMEGAAVFENQGSSDLFHVADSGGLFMSWSTIAGNLESDAGGRVFRLEGSFATLDFDGGIVWEPGNDLVSAGASGAEARADCTIGHQAEPDSGFDSTSFYSHVDPGLRDPGAGDLRLNLSSPAVDYCNDAATSAPAFGDMFDNARGIAVDGPIKQPPDAPGGPFDLGVHELQSLELEIFADRFEDS
ncbi:hypothetical protein G4Y73_09240 [Wenzhouxiangella sp. XN201]|nr:hypothetical protein [Wenzhouxiangella sp. XN201]